MPAPSQVLAQGGKERPVLVVDRGASAELEVVLPHLLQPLTRDPAAAGDVLEERDDVLELLGPPKDTSRRASYGLGSDCMGPIVGSATIRRAWRRPPTLASMLSSYRQVLAEPGTLRSSAAGLVARLPISMVGLGIVLLVSSATGSYGLAGAVSAAYMVTNACLSILQAHASSTASAKALVLTTASAVFRSCHDPCS